MLRNLKAEMARESIKAKDLAEHLNVRTATIYDKLNGHYDFTLNEALRIKKYFFPTHNLEYLFSGSTEDHPLSCVEKTTNKKSMAGGE